jgi:hypothetical protein
MNLRYRRLKYKILSRLGIWVTGIYVDGECVNWYMRQTIIRRLINRFWDWCYRRGIGDMECGDMPDFRYLDYGE